LRHSPWQAYEVRALIILVDGLDEGAGLKERIEEFIVDELAASGLRLVVTARPEGVRPVFFEDFVVMNLLPLTAKQQNSLISKRIGGSDFFDHLSAFCDIRTIHDQVYCAAFPESSRLEIETLPRCDELVLESGQKNPQMRQRTRDGDAFVKISGSAVPQSDFLQACCKSLNVDVLGKIDDAIARLPTSASFEQVQEALDHLPDRGSTKNLAVKLGLLTLKRREPKPSMRAILEKHGLPIGSSASELWACIVRRTDELYLAVEDMSGPVHEAFQELARRLNAKDGEFGARAQPVIACAG
jgi:hypothetical protein